jgi:mRNA interferase RelE/StbE
LPAAGSYTINFARSARRELERLPTNICAVAMRHIEALCGNPRPPGVKKLYGPGEFWRLRVGDYRVIYSIDDTNRIVDVAAVRHRKDAYR